ncbi:MAG: nucleotidyltransferase family protein [Lachnospiraceae bacterium]|nr:nucleotidyltransferase family protein [Lachnospiraceae bacterium]
MKICGIIAEFNPLHNGHAGLLRYAKESLGADGIVVVMSGEHVQRGEPAIADKYLRTKAALMAGADLVLELPVYAAAAKATEFAAGAVAALANTGIVDFLLFGSETGDIDELKKRAEEPSAFIADFSERPGPNDVLAAEYIRAVRKYAPELGLATIKRTGPGYNDMEADGSNASAACIRHILETHGKDAYAYMPDFSKELFEAYLKTSCFMDISAYSALLNYRLITERNADLCRYAGIVPDLADKIKKSIPAFKDYSSFIQLLKSKDLTYSHISRTLLHILLDIRSEDCLSFSDTYSYCPYLRILGIKKEASGLLHSFGSNASVPVISRLSDAEKLLDKTAYELLMHELSAAAIYHMCSERSLPAVSEFSRFLIRM